MDQLCYDNWYHIFDDLFHEFKWYALDGDSGVELLTEACCAFYRFTQCLCREMRALSWKYYGGENHILFYQPGLGRAFRLVVTMRRVNSKFIPVLKSHIALWPLLSILDFTRGSKLVDFCISTTRMSDFTFGLSSTAVLLLEAFKPLQSIVYLSDNHHDHILLDNMLAKGIQTIAWYNLTDHRPLTDRIQGEPVYWFLDADISDHTTLRNFVRDHPHYVFIRLSRNEQ